MERNPALSMQVLSDACVVWFAELITPEPAASWLYMSVILAIGILDQGKSVRLRTLFTNNAM
jgi:hypothetical protein